MINNKILIVDDEPDICDLVSDILSENGYSVKSAFSKDEAIKVMENSGISLVITDIWMNDNEKEGFELLEWCKACLLYTSPSPRDRIRSRMPSSA